LAVASPVVFFTILNAMPSSVLFAKGRPGLHRRAVMLGAAAMLVSVYPACRFLGPVGGQVASLFAAVVGYFFQLFLVRSVTDLSLVQYASTFLTPALGSIAMLAIVLSGRRLGLTIKPGIDIVFCVAGCLLAFGISASARMRASKRHEGLYEPETAESATVG
jgi:uncharacterized membrane protein YiaA